MAVRSSREFQIADLHPGDWLLMRDGDVRELREIDPRAGGALVLEDPTRDLEDADYVPERLSQAAAAGGGVVRVVRRAPPPPPVEAR